MGTVDNTQRNIYDIRYEEMLRTGTGVDVHFEEVVDSPSEMSPNAFSFWAKNFSHNQWASRNNDMEIHLDIARQLV